jgi:hypothetical protein
VLLTLYRSSPKRVKVYTLKHPTPKDRCVVYPSLSIGLPQRVRGNPIKPWVRGNPIKPLLEGIQAIKLLFS